MFMKFYGLAPFSLYRDVHVTKEQQSRLFFISQASFYTQLHFQNHLLYVFVFQSNLSWPQALFQLLKSAGSQLLVTSLFRMRLFYLICLGIKPWDVAWASKFDLLVGGHF